MPVFFFIRNFIVFKFILFFIYISKNNNEHLSINNIINKQLENESLYSSSINLDYKNYIEKKYKIIKPDVLIIGSSRMQYYPNYLFNTKMLIAQQPFYSFEMFYTSLVSLLEIHKPKIIIVGLDWWLFNKNYNKNNSKLYSRLLNQKISINEDKNKTFFDFSLNELLKPYLWIINQKISIKFFYENIKNNNLKNIGVASNLYKSGYNIEGYYSDTHWISGRKNFDLNFEYTKNLIQKNAKDFIPFEFDDNSIKIIQNINRIVKLNNIELINIFSPIAPTIYQELNKNEYLKHFEEITKQLENIDNIYNFTKKDYYNDCQFLDGIHAGEVLNFLNLKHISKNNTILKELISKTISDEIIRDNLYRVTFNNINKIGKFEKDFLQLGCKK